MDARLANELVFEERDDEHVNAATTPCEQPQPKRKKKRKGAHDEDVHVTQNNVEHNGAKKKKSKGNAKEKDPKQKKKKKTRDRQHVEDPADGGANTTTDNHTTIDNMGGVRLFRKVPPGVPCRLDIVNRPCTDPLQHKGVDRPPGRQSKGTQRHGRAGPTSDDDDDSDDPDARLLQVVVDATAIYKSAERAAKEAAANISNELIGALCVMVVCGAPWT